MHSRIVASIPRAGESGAFLYDRFGRRLDYVRLSVTDRCNLRCRYCMPPEGIRTVDRAEVLSWEEMYRICLLLSDLGARKIRITGGEPLVRSGAVEFISRLAELPGRPERTLTTNATLLEEHVDDLASAGIDRINVSLDSLRRERYLSLAGRDLLHAALRGIEAAASRGLSLKLNAVIMAGVNEDEIGDFVSLTADREITVRFIEAMPFDGRGGTPDELLDGDSILERVRKRFDVESDPDSGSSVEELYQVPGFAGKVGIIRGYTRSFCGDCSRLRVNAIGRLRTCLYADPSLDLRALLRGGFESDEISRLIGRAVWLRHPDGRRAEAAAEGRNACSMSRIGG